MVMMAFQLKLKYISKAGCTFLVASYILLVICELLRRTGLRVSLVFEITDLKSSGRSSALIASKHLRVDEWLSLAAKTRYSLASWHQFRLLLLFLRSNSTEFNRVQKPKSNKRISISMVAEDTGTGRGERLRDDVTIA